MHFFIDGYNLLFRISHGSHRNLQSQREAIVQDLASKVSLLQIDASIVFDSAYHGEGPHQLHFQELEILFTSEGESADEFILDELKNSLSPQNETVVTSDRQLAWLARNQHAQTKSVEEFIYWLNRSYKNKLHRKKKEKPSPLLLPQNEATQEKLVKIPEGKVSMESCTEYYQQIFETGWREILQKEENDKLQKSSASPKKLNKKAAKKLQPAIHEQRNEATEMERWQRIFEEQLNKQQEQ